MNLISLSSMVPLKLALLSVLTFTDAHVVEHLEAGDTFQEQSIAVSSSGGMMRRHALATPAPRESGDVEGVATTAQDHLSSIQSDMILACPGHATQVINSHRSDPTKCTTNHTITATLEKGAEIENNQDIETEIVNGLKVIYKKMQITEDGDCGDKCMCKMRKVQCIYLFNACAESHLEGEVTQASLVEAGSHETFGTLHVRIVIEPAKINACNILSEGGTESDCGTTLDSSSSFIQKMKEKPQRARMPSPSMGHRAELIQLAERLNISRVKKLRKLTEKEQRMLPESYDPRVTYPQCFPSDDIFLQGDCGACWVFSSVGSVSDRMCIKEAKHKEEQCAGIPSSAAENHEYHYDESGHYYDEYHYDEYHYDDHHYYESLIELGHNSSIERPLRKGKGKWKLGPKGKWMKRRLKGKGKGKRKEKAKGKRKMKRFIRRKASLGQKQLHGHSEHYYEGDHYYYDEHGDHYYDEHGDHYYEHENAHPEDYLSKEEVKLDEKQEEEYHYPEMKGTGETRPEEHTKAEPKPPAKKGKGKPPKPASACGGNSLAPGDKYRVQLSVQQVLSCIPPQEMDGQTYQMGCTGGHYQFAFNAMTEGVYVDIDNEYQAENGPQKPPWAGECKKGMQPRYKVVDFAQFLIQNKDFEPIRKQLYEKGSMYMAFDVYADFFTFPHDQGKVWKRGADSGDFTGGHAGIAIGYGRSEEEEKYLLVRNSWGKSWGDGGYFKFSENYETVCKAVPPADHCLLDFGGAEVEKIAENIPSVQWVISKWGECSVTCGEGGSKYRSVLCVNTATGKTDTGCNPDQKPPEAIGCGCGECPACEFQSMPALKYDGANVNDHGGKLGKAKQQCVEAMLGCAKGNVCCHGITCTGGNTEFQMCHAKKGPGLIKATGGENSYTMDCTQYLIEKSKESLHSNPTAHQKEGYHCPVDEWGTWGTCCGSPGWRQRQRSVVDMSQCNGIPPPLVEQESCQATSCKEHKYWIVDKGDGTVEVRGENGQVVNATTHHANGTKKEHQVKEEGFLPDIVPEKDGIVMIEGVGFVAVGGLACILIAFLAQGEGKKKDEDEDDKDKDDKKDDKDDKGDDKGKKGDHDKDKKGDKDKH